MNDVAQIDYRSLAGWGLVALAWLAGCGVEPAPEISLRFTGPGPSPLATQTCDASLDSELSAELRVGGYDGLDCPLEIVDRVATGSCDGIATGIVRPVVLVWMHPAPAHLGSSRPLPLAYFLTYVDLVKSSLEGGVDTISVSFVNDDVGGVIVTEQAEIDAIDSPAPGGATELDEAKAWLVEDGRQKNNIWDLTLDHDSDTCRNLTEACNDTAEDAAHDHQADAVLYPCDP